jgi:MFS-type transporter involved in bile tolerance (Atg22 family)
MDTRSGAEPGLQGPGRATFLNISSFQILAMFRRGMFYNYLSIYLRYFLGLSVTETTFFATFPMALNILSQSLLWGRLSDRLQLRRTLVIVGELAAAFATTLVWFVHTLPSARQSAGYVVIVGLSLVEIFWSMSNVGWSALLSDLYPAHRRAGVQGKLLALGGIGRMAGIWTGGLAYDGLSRFYEGWGFDKGLLFFIASGIMLLSTIPMYFVPEGGVTRGPAPPRRQTGQHSNTPELHHSPGQDVLGGLSRQYVLFLLAMVFINFGRNSVALTKAQYLSLDEGFNLSSTVLSYVLNMGSLAIVLVGLSVDRLARKLEDWVLLLAGTGLALVYLVGFAASRSLPLVFLSNFLSGASQVVIRASSYSYAARLIPPSQRARSFAYYNATHFLSWGIPATFVAGPIVDRLSAAGMPLDSSYRVSFLAAAALVMVGAAILLAVRRTGGGSQQSPAGDY